MVKITGTSEHEARLAKLAGSAFVADVGKALFVVGSAIAVDAAISITNGAISGKGHVPSRPGEPPKNDSGQLAREIEVTQPAPLKVEVAAYSGHAVPLEFGTVHIAERPFMRPAAKKNRDSGLAAIAAVVNRANQS